MDIYIIDTKTIGLKEAEALSALSADRREKALRLRSGEARRGSIAAGLLLRRYLGDAALHVAPQGKPYADDAPFFSLSHSGDRAVLALSDVEIGVDTEKPSPYREGVARRVFTEDELLYLSKDPDSRFLRLWTRKEAVLKLLGCGLARSMNDFSVLENRFIADGREIFLQSVLWNGWWLSAASEKAEELHCTTVTADDCLLGVPADGKEEI